MTIYRPLYKKFLRINKNIQNRIKIQKFKKLKWSKFLENSRKISKINKHNCYYKFFDQDSFFVPKFTVYFNKKFKNNLINKQRLNLYYGKIPKNNMKRYVKSSTKNFNLSSVILNNKKFLLNNLEMRLDTLLFRSNFTISIRNSRQLISHNHILVNGRIVKRKNFRLSKGDNITVSKKGHNLVRKAIISAPFWPLPPKNLQINYKTLQIIILEDTMVYNSSLNHNFKLDLQNIINKY